TLPVRTHRLGSAETSLDVEDRAIAQQQDRASWHFAETEFVLLERRSLATRAGRDSRLAKPLVEPDLGELRFVAWKERAFVDLGPEVTSVAVWDHVPGVVARAEAAFEELGEVEQLGPADFHGVVQGRNRCDLRERSCDVVSRNRLDVHRRHANGGAVRRR